MTPSDPHHGTAGNLLLKIARLIFVEPTLSSVVYPAVADFQQELHEAGMDRSRRFAARARACWAFAKLFVVLFASSPIGGRAGESLPDRAGGGTLILLVVVLLASTWPFFGWFMAFAMIGGILLAITMRRWHDRHPTVVADADPDTGMRRPEINLSRVPVAGNAGGLIFAVGSVVIVIVGLPELRWFLLAALLSGVCAGGALVAWRRSHPAETQPRNSIALR
jgi:hypothetical protein